MSNSATSFDTGRPPGTSRNEGPVLIDSPAQVRAAMSGPDSRRRRRRKNLLIGLFTATFVCVMLWDRIFYTVEAGQGGVLFCRFWGGTELSRTYGEGCHFVWPWDEFTTYDLRIQTRSFPVFVMTHDALSVQVDATVVFRADPDGLPLLHQTLGPEYADKFIVPAVTSSVREVVGNRKPEELTTDRSDQMQHEILTHTADALKDTHIVCEDLIVMRVVLPPALREAIESKLRQEQAALEYQYRLEREQQEAERKRIEAEGIDRYQHIIGENLTNKLLAWKSIESAQALAQSPNSKVIILGGSQQNAMFPIMLGGGWGDSKMEPDPVPLKAPGAANLAAPANVSPNAAPAAEGNAPVDANQPAPPMPVPGEAALGPVAPPIDPKAGAPATPPEKAPAKEK